MTPDHHSQPIKFAETVGSKDLLVDLVGVYAVQDYERVKRASMQLAKVLERRLLEHVDGRLALRGERCDGITNLGKWEFCLQRNTKNSAGRKADELRCPGRCVQILEAPNVGWISGAQFLSMHGYDAGDLGGIINAAMVELRAGFWTALRLQV